MAQFQELIKNFDRIRDYMRQFYVYGFKVRGEFTEKSTRTYDNERRRIESWLSGCISSDYTAKGKQISISADSRSISSNPLYSAWKSKSFTDNDLLLHFFVLHYLMQHRKAEQTAEGGQTEQAVSGTHPGMTAGELADQISADFGCFFDSQTVRLKLKEYENLGILRSGKSGRNLVYALSPRLPVDDAAWSHLMDAMEFFQEAAPFGFIGSTILDREDRCNSLFQFKHHFIVHTLEDGVLAHILTAIHDRRMITYENKSSRSNAVSTHTCVPLKILVSTQTGRRYLCLYHPELRRFSNARLDSIQKVVSGEPYEAYSKVLSDLEQNQGKCWGVSFGNGRNRLQEVCIKLRIDEEKEPYILNRLYREGRGGQVMKIRENEYLYSGMFFDTNEMLSWIKTFTGRILDIQGTDQFSIAKITHDWEKMYQMYCGADVQP